MPWLDAGNVKAFLKLAQKNVDILSRVVPDGTDIAVLQPTCGYVLKKEYPEYLGTEAAKEVASHCFDVSEHLMRLNRAGDLDTNFTGTTPKTVALHAPCHLRAQNIGYRSRDLIKLTGADVTVVDRCSGIDGTWGLRAKNYEMAKKVAQPLKNAIEKAAPELVVGDCHLANGAIVEETGHRPVHPVQLIARAYGIAEEQPS
jgi:Fe-S oxidoreductase